MWPMLCKHLVSLILSPSHTKCKNRVSRWVMSLQGPCTYMPQLCSEPRLHNRTGEEITGPCWFLDLALRDSDFSGLVCALNLPATGGFFDKFPEVDSDY